MLYSKEYIQVELYYYPPGYDISTQDIPEHNNLNESMLEKDYTGYVTNERRRVALGDVAGVDSASCAARGVSQCAAERVFLQLKKPDTHCEYPVGTNIMAHFQNSLPTIQRISVNAIHRSRSIFNKR